MESAEPGGSLTTAQTPTTSEKVRFADLPIPPRILETIARLGFVHPTPIQEQAIPPTLQGRDLIGKAETGTGKTLAFGVPLCARVDPGRVSVQALVLCPTRELAQQVGEVLETMGEHLGFKVALLVGGEKVGTQVLGFGTSQVVVGTPGRVLDLIRQNFLKLGWVEVAVLDEADRMLEMGFIEDVTAIMDRVPEEAQTLFFSATFPPELKRLALRILKDPVSVETSQGLATVPEIRQYFLRTGEQKFRALRDVLRAEEHGSVIVFCNKKREVDRVYRELWGRGVTVAAIHGDYEQEVRFKVLERFRTGAVRILVATDVAARGLDIEKVTAVINHEVPLEAEDYVHRIGRTGRCGRDGKVVTLVSPREERLFQRILKRTGWHIAELGAPARPAPPPRAHGPAPAPAPPAPPGEGQRRRRGGRGPRKAATPS
jgi:ATP-dependent RNA helicase DeaD